MTPENTGLLLALTGLAWLVLLAERAVLRLAQCDQRAQYVALLLLGYGCCWRCWRSPQGKATLSSLDHLLAVGFGVLLAALLLFGWGLRAPSARTANGAAVGAVDHAAGGGAQRGGHERVRVIQDHRPDGHGLNGGFADRLRRHRSQPQDKQRRQRWKHNLLPGQTHCQDTVGNEVPAGTAQAEMATESGAADVVGDAAAADLLADAATQQKSPELQPDRRQSIATPEAPVEVASGSVSASRRLLYCARRQANALARTNLETGAFRRALTMTAPTSDRSQRRLPCHRGHIGDHRDANDGIDRGQHASGNCHAGRDNQHHADAHSGA